MIKTMTQSTCQQRIKKEIDKHHLELNLVVDKFKTKRKQSATISLQNLLNQLTKGVKGFLIQLLIKKNFKKISHGKQLLLNQTVAFNMTLASQLIRFNCNKCQQIDEWRSKFRQLSKDITSFSRIKINHRSNKINSHNN